MESKERSSDGVFLVLDETVFEEIDGLSLTPQEWTKMDANPVLTPGPQGSVDEIGCCAGSVIRGDDKFRYFYDAFSLCNGADDERYIISKPAVAESDDGIHWTRPDIGLVEFRGNKNNNLLDIRFDDGTPVRPTEFHPWLVGFGGSFSGNVFRDPEEKDKSKRFKAAMSGNILPRHFNDWEPLDSRGPAVRGAGTGPKTGYWPPQQCHPTIYGIGTSPDGIRWTVKRRKDDKPIVGRLEVGTLFRASDRSLCLCGQNLYVDPSDGSYGRAVTLYLSEDENLEKWRLIDERAIAMPRNEVGLQTHVAPSNPAAKFGIGLQTHVSPSVTRFGNVYVALSGIFHNAAEGTEQFFEAELVRSQDGIHWNQIMPGYPVLRRGDYGAWDGGAVRQLPYLIDAGKKTIIWYHGFSIANEGGEKRHHVLGCAFVPRHRFAYLACTSKYCPSRRDKRKGTCLTGRIQLKKSQDLNLLLNVGNMDPGAQITVAVLQEDGKALDDFSAEDCVPVKQEGIAVPVRWARKNLAELGGRVVRLRFNIQASSAKRSGSPKLYEFSFNNGAPL